MRSWPQLDECSFVSVTITLSPFFETFALLRRVGAARAREGGQATGARGPQGSGR